MLTVPENKSGTFNSARSAVGLLKEYQPKLDTRVVVVDTGTTAAGVEYLAQEAIRLVSAGEFFSHVVDRIKYLRSRIEIFFTLDKIDYISASGRVEELASHKLSSTLKSYAIGLASWFARFTHHSPKVVIRFKDGKEKIVGFSRFYPQAVTLMSQEVRKVLSVKGLKQVYLYQRDSDSETESLLTSLELSTDVEIVIKHDLPIALLSILGPKFIALVCVYDHMP